jgi:glycosyltransferase involved in cell wall biosynthesis/quercetin dioxygenase-like cupin family protein
MRIAMLAPIAWRAPPKNYGPWESVTSLLTEGLVSRGHKVTLFATGDSQTSGSLHAVCARGYEEDPSILPKVWECLHISELFERADQFDIIHNQFDFLPLSYSGLVDTPMLTTIHGFSSPKILPVYEKYNGKTFYVSISDADRAAELDYIRTIHHGIDLKQFEFQSEPDDETLLFFGRIHPDKGAKEALEVAKACGKKLILAGIIQDKDYFHQYVEPQLDEQQAVYIGSVGPVQRNQLLGKASALLHLIQFDEPFGLSVIESMACGTPVIAFNRGSMPELIEDEKNGFLVNTIEEAIAAVARIGEIDRAECRRRVERDFTIERMTEQYIEVYQQILNQNQKEERKPWGYYKVIADQPGYKAKEIVVMPNERLSLQRHQRRTEHWYILEGQAEVTLGEQIIQCGVGESLDILKNTRHRVANKGTTELRFIEVQRGDYFGEDDIERFDDDYGRV